MSKPNIGEIFQERYLIVSALGSGAMGAVYRAKQLDADRDVALKLLRTEITDDEENVERFYREFKALARLSHPNIMTLYALARVSDGLPYAICEYIEGESLRELISKNKIDSYTTTSNNNIVSDNKEKNSKVKDSENNRDNNNRTRSNTEVAGGAGGGLCSEAARPTPELSGSSNNRDSNNTDSNNKNSNNRVINNRDNKGKDGNSIHWQRALKIAIQICAAMQYAHEQGIIHRDLKPENIMLLPLPEPDFVKLVDFGLSRIAISNEEFQNLTSTGQLIGTANYMSPEIVNARADNKSDIYSLGCVLFELLTGEFLFDADVPVGIIFKHCNENPSSRFKAIKTLVPSRLITVLAKTLAKDPSKRYASMELLANELKSILDSPGENRYWCQRACGRAKKTNKKYFLEASYKLNSSANSGSGCDKIFE